MRPAGPGPPSGDCKTGNPHFGGVAGGQSADGGPPLAPGRHLRAFFSAVCAEGEKFKPSVQSAKGAGVGQRDTPPSFLWVWDSGVAEQGRSMAGNP